MAVKSLHEHAQYTDRKSILQEAMVTAQFTHAHTVNLIGVVTVGEPILVVLEYVTPLQSMERYRVRGISY